MSIQLKSKDLTNTQQLEVAVNGPDGATHLILCTGVANLGPASHTTYTFLVGPFLSRRQFVGAIVSGALSAIQGYDRKLRADRVAVERGADLISIDANYDDDSNQVKVRAEVSCGTAMTRLAISYQVSILAELLSY
jgi:hypothetical protein